MNRVAEATVEYVTVDHFGALGIATKSGADLRFFPLEYVEYLTSHEAVRSVP